MNCKGYFNFTLSGYFMMVLPLTLGVSLIAANTPAMQRAFRPCVSGCTCNNVTVICTGLRLTKIPHRLPLDTVVLDLSSNKISRIHVQRLSYMPDLRKLYLRENHIAFIPDNMWRDLPQLKILDLSSNSIACRCPLPWLQAQLDNMNWDLQLLNQGMTDCRRYFSKITDLNVPPNIDACILKSRQRRFPPCDYVDCSHGRCVMYPSPRCICDDHYTGTYCTERIAESNHVTITIERTTTNSIQISWTVQAPDEYSFFINITHMSSVGSSQSQSFRTNEQTYLIDNLQPSTTYTLCVTAVGVHTFTGCINKTTPSLNTTIIPTAGSKVPTLVQVDSNPNDDERGRGNLYNHKNDDPRSEGDELEYAFISLAALFGICLLLTILVGFVYYKRIYGATPQDMGTDNPEASTPNQHGVVVVSTGNEIIYNRGAVNPAYGPYDGEDNTPPRRQPGTRSVRFNLTHQPGYSAADTGAAVGGTSAVAGGSGIHKGVPAIGTKDIYSPE